MKQTEQQLKKDRLENKRFHYLRIGIERFDDSGDEVSNAVSGVLAELCFVFSNAHTEFEVYGLLHSRLARRMVRTASERVGTSPDDLQLLVEEEVSDASVATP